ncbi:reverse transcriptase [Aeromonas caviae]|uniref:reverse transcriptase family protein n=1 Tax=Aeromonas TaxID=642 RepID=UPI0015DC3D33|nr:MULTISPECIES: reverse transcriptase family protein [Aeromonas]WEA32020.1 reverse transcriptase family protein [Aeromonas hydrophila]BBT06078.1 reverse transcriptase [Aeromonas hydrophila]GKQ64145.1 reverse transcriptase [Aeromonas caviae]
MKSYTINSTVIATLETCSFYSKGKGVESFPYSQVKECKLNNKFIYKLSGADTRQINEIHDILIKTLFDKLPINNAATAYLKNKSYLDFLEPHRNSNYFLRIDLKNFFHFINKKIVKEVLFHHVSSDPISEKTTQSSLDLITNLLTITLPNNVKNLEFSGKSILPIGFKTSPAVSNIIFRKFDILIEKFCSRHDVLYTRYADDMLFSSSDTRTEQYIEKSLFDILLPPPNTKPFLHSSKFTEQIAFILNLGGFKINTKKTSIAKGNFTVNGYTISGSNYPYKSGTIRISNKKTKTISKLIHECKKNLSDEDVLNIVFKYNHNKVKFRYKPSAKFLAKYHSSQLDNKLMGYRSYLISLLSFNDRHNCMTELFIKKCSNLVSEIDIIMKSRMV